jgi:hypothetical protein
MQAFRFSSPVEAGPLSSGQPQLPADAPTTKPALAFPRGAYALAARNQNLRDALDNYIPPSDDESASVKLARLADGLLAQGDAVTDADLEKLSVILAEESDLLPGIADRVLRLASTRDTPATGKIAALLYDSCRTRQNEQRIPTPLLSTMAAGLVAPRNFKLYSARFAELLKTSLPPKSLATFLNAMAENVYKPVSEIMDEGSDEEKRKKHAACENIRIFLRMQPLPDEALARVYCHNTTQEDFELVTAAIAQRTAEGRAFAPVFVDAVVKMAGYFGAYDAIWLNFEKTARLSSHEKIQAPSFSALMNEIADLKETDPDSDATATHQAMRMIQLLPSLAEDLLMETFDLANADKENGDAEKAHAAALAAARTDALAVFAAKMHRRLLAHPDAAYARALQRALCDLEKTAPALTPVMARFFFAEPADAPSFPEKPLLLDRLLRNSPRAVQTEILDARLAQKEGLDRALGLDPSPENDPATGALRRLFLSSPAFVQAIAPALFAFAIAPQTRNAARAFFDRALREAAPSVREKLTAVFLTRPVWQGKKSLSGDAISQIEGFLHKAFAKNPGFAENLATHLNAYAKAFKDRPATQALPLPLQPPSRTKKKPTPGRTSRERPARNAL